MIAFNFEVIAMIVSLFITKKGNKINSKCRDVRRDQKIYQCDTSQFDKVFTSSRVKRQLNVIGSEAMFSRRKLQNFLKGVNTLHQKDANRVIPIDTKNEDVIDTFYLRTFLEKLYAKGDEAKAIHEFLCDNDDDDIVKFFVAKAKEKNKPTHKFI